MTRRGGTLEERLWRRCDKSADPDGCWLWTGPTSQGYGLIMDNYHQRGAHRVAYELLVGPIPAGLELDHLCRVTRCLNPAHMEPVTRHENILRSDGLSARLARRTHCANGHPLSGDNIRMKGGTRVCLTCRRSFAQRGQTRRNAVGQRVRDIALAVSRDRSLGLRYVPVPEGAGMTTHAVAASSDALGVQPREGGPQPTPPLHLWPEPDGFHIGTIAEANALLREHHYLGPVDWARLVICQWAGGHVVGAMVWRTPTSRRLPSDGSWLELARWCLTPEGGPNAGSRMHRAAVRELKLRHPEVTTLVSYSDRAVGHTGSLYRACNWQWRPTWMRLSPPPTGNGSWDGITQQEPKDRWVFALRPDPRREDVLYLEPTYARMVP